MEICMCQGFTEEMLGQAIRKAELSRQSIAGVVWSDGGQPCARCAAEIERLVARAAAPARSERSSSLLGEAPHA